MAHSRPDAVTNHGQARRLSTAVGAFIVELTVDRRVLAYYDTWRAARAQTDREFEHLLAEHRETIEAYIAGALRQDHLVTAPFVRAVLLHRLPVSWTNMVTANLLHAFRTVHYHGRTRADEPPAVPPATAPQFGVAVQLQSTHKRGRVPRDPYPVTHNMRWLYRRYVQEPRDSLRVLAREHASVVKRDPDDCLPDVKRCLKQAWSLLDLAARSEWSDHGRIVVPKK